MTLTYEPECDPADRDGLAAMTAFGLVGTGRGAEGLELLPVSMPGVLALLQQRIGTRVKPPPGLLGDLASAWVWFHQGTRHHESFKGFLDAARSGLPWVTTWGWLGLAKLATVFGHLATADRWCVWTSALARHHEHMDLLAAALGARAEVLLRSGMHRAAAECCTLNLALLPPGSRYRGRVYCYQAHAWARLGAYTPAELAYRLASNQPGEPQTRAFALNGLAMLGFLQGSDTLVNESCDVLCGIADPSPEQSLCAAWACVFRAERIRIHENHDPAPWRDRAYHYMPESKLFQYLWMHHWQLAMGGQATRPAPTITPTPPFDTVTDAPPTALTGFDEAAAVETLPDGGFAAMIWGSDPATLLQQRSQFLP